MLVLEDMGTGWQLVYAALSVLWAMGVRVWFVRGIPKDRP